MPKFKNCNLFNFKINFNFYLALENRHKINIKKYRINIKKNKLYKLFFLEKYFFLKHFLLKKFSQEINLGLKT